MWKDMGACGSMWERVGACGSVWEDMGGVGRGGLYVCTYRTRPSGFLAVIEEAYSTFICICISSRSCTYMHCPRWRSRTL